MKNFFFIVYTIFFLPTVLEGANQPPLDVDAYSPQYNSASTFRNARALLRQYLQVFWHFFQ